MILMCQSRKQKLIFKQKRYVTLLEVLIALGLLIILTTFIFGFYRGIDGMHTELDKTRQENFRLLYVQNRLADVLPFILPYDPQEPPRQGKKEKRKPFIFTSKDGNSALKENSLVFVYDNGYDIYPWFANTVLGRLYLDRNGSLCLSSWPVPKQWLKEGNQLGMSPMKKEVLLEGVREMAFEFFVPPAYEKKVVDPSSVDAGKEKIDPETGKWHHEWLQNYQELPAMIKISITREPSSQGKESRKVVLIYSIANYGKAFLYTKGSE